MSTTAYPQPAATSTSDFTGDPSPQRTAALRHWLVEQAGRLPLQPESLALLAADASFRRYFRVALRTGIALDDCIPTHPSLVVLDAPPEREAIEPFLRVAGCLHALDLRAPRCIAHDLTQGFALLEDFGDRTFTRALAAGSDEATLYRRAVDTLAHLQTRWRCAACDAEIAAYDRDTLLAEVRLFLDWHFEPWAGRPATIDERQRWDAAWHETLDRLPPLGTTLVLRDYHVDNLVDLATLPSAGTAPEDDAHCGLLDFQDARIGSPAYDLVSLLEDVRRDVAPGVAADCRKRFLATTGLPATAFAAHESVFGLQRALKIAGIFTRLDRRDGKPGYLRHQPRVWKWIARHLAAGNGSARPATVVGDILQPVCQWFQRLPFPHVAPVEASVETPPGKTTA